MSDTDATVFVVTIQAEAGPENSVPDGRRYDLLVFARGEDEAAAADVAARGLTALGWIEIEILRSGEVTDPAALPEDFRDTYRRATELGCSVIVYDEA
jgi:hypothetical protein